MDCMDNIVKICVTGSEILHNSNFHAELAIRILDSTEKIYYRPHHRSSRSTRNRLLLSATPDELLPTPQRLRPRDRDLHFEGLGSGDATKTPYPCGIAPTQFSRRSPRYTHLLTTKKTKTVGNNLSLALPFRNPKNPTVVFVRRQTRHTSRSRIGNRLLLAKPRILECNRINPPNVVLNSLDEENANNDASTNPPLHPPAAPAQHNKLQHPNNNIIVYFTTTPTPPPSSSHCTGCCSASRIARSIYRISPNCNPPEFDFSAWS